MTRLLQSYSTIMFSKLTLFIMVLTLIGAVLRLYHIDSTLIFLGDQGRDASIVRRLITDGDIILVGPTTSVGKIQLGPLYYYFMAPFLYLSSFNPVGPAVGVALLGTATIPLIFFVTRRLFNTPAAVITSSLYTFGHVIILHTRGSWNPNPMPFVILLFIWGLWEAYQNRKYQFLVLAWAAYATALQLHYMVLLLGPFFAIMHLFILIPVMKANRTNLPKLFKHPAITKTLWGIVVFILFALPLIIFDLRHDYLNYRGFLEFFQKGHHTSQSLFDSVKNMEGRMFQGIGTLLGFLPNYALRNRLSWLIILVFAAYLLVRRRHLATQMLALFLTTSLIGLGLYEGDVFEHYIGFLFPIPFMIIGAVLGDLYHLKHPLFKAIPVVVTLAIIYLNTTRYSFYTPLGWQISDIKQTADLIATDAGTTIYNIALLDNTKDYRAMNYRYFAEMTPSQLLPQDNYASAQVLYLISEKPASDLDLVTIDVWEIQSFSGKTITKTWELDKNLGMYKIEP